MKIEIEKNFPQYFKPAYPEEFELFSHFEVTAGIPTVLFAITTWKENGKPNVCFHSWSCFHGDKTAFFAVMGNLYQHTHTYGICSKDSNAMKSDNPKSGFYEAETSRCLDANGGNPTCNQGGMAVVALQGSMIGRADKNGPQGSGVNEDVSFTLDAADRHAVAYCMTTGIYTQALEEQSPTLMARDYKDPPVVNETEPEYIVRRLTPTECARLQGFPDWWCAGLGTDEPTEDEIEFWTAVFETHRSVMGTSSKPKRRNQIVKWLRNPHSDSAEYKMWGNGVALPNVYFVLSGIVYYAQFPEG